MLKVVSAGPTVPCRSTAASTMRCRVSACCSARRLRVYVRAINFTTLACAINIDKSENFDTHSCTFKSTAWETAVETKIAEIADGIYRLSTFVPDIAPPAGFTFNQFLILGDDPLLFHTGLRQMCRRKSCAGSPSATTRLTSAAR